MNKTLETPTETAKDDVGRKRAPKRGRQYRCFPDGDYFPMIAADGTDDAPAGSLLPVILADGKTAQFETFVDAVKWLRASGGAKLAGRTVSIVQFKRKMSIALKSEPTIVIDEAPRTMVRDPGAERSDG